MAFFTSYPSVMMLSFVVLNVIMLSVVLLIVIMRSVSAPSFLAFSSQQPHFCNTWCQFYKQFTVVIYNCNKISKHEDAIDEAGYFHTETNCLRLQLLNACNKVKGWRCVIIYNNKKVLSIDPLINSIGHKCTHTHTHTPIHPLHTHTPTHPPTPTATATHTHTHTHSHSHIKIHAFILCVGGGGCTHMAKSIIRLL